MDAISPEAPPFSAAKVAQLNTDQPAYHALIVASNTARSNQTAQSSVVAALRHTARLWVSHGFQALLNACIREQFPNSAKNFYGLPLDGNKGPVLSSDLDITQAAVTYNDGETARVAAGGDPITFPSLVGINAQVDGFKAAQQTQTTLMGVYDAAQEDLAATNTAIDLLILQLWNAIEAEYDTGDKPSMRRKSRKWGVVYIPSPGETPSGEDFSVIGLVKDMLSGLPLEHVELSLNNVSVSETYITMIDGMYFMPPVASGTYELKAILVGYLPFSTSVTVVEGEIQEVNISLQPDMPPPPPLP